MTSANTTDRLIEGCVNASLAQPRSADDLARLLASDPPLDFEPHLTALLTEVPTAVLARFVIERRIDATNVWRLYQWLHTRFGDTNPEIDDWLGYLAETPR